jgi:hypothetical protein
MWHLTLRRKNKMNYIELLKFYVEKNDKLIESGIGKYSLLQDFVTFLESQQKESHTNIIKQIEAMEKSEFAESLTFEEFRGYAYALENVIDLFKGELVDEKIKFDKQICDVTELFNTCFKKATNLVQNFSIQSVNPDGTVEFIRANEKFIQICKIALEMAQHFSNTMASNLKE